MCTAWVCMYTFVCDSEFQMLAKAIVRVRTRELTLLGLCRFRSRD